MVNNTFTLADRESALETIKQLSEADLRFLNRAIVDRLKLIQTARKTASMAQFAVGDSVTFRDKQGELITAEVIRLNKKTVSLLTDEGDRWNVAPELLELQTSMNEDLFAEFSTDVSPGGQPSVASTVSEENASVDEWVGGVIPMPGYVTGEGAPYRPEALIWMNGEGLVLSMAVSKPGDKLQQAYESLRQAIDNPMVGKAHYPGKLRIADTEIIDHLKSTFPSVDFVHASTPELDTLAETMRNDLRESAGPPTTYLSSGLAPGAVASLFKSAADLFRAKPWERVPDDQCLLCVTVDSLGIHDAALSVIGQMGESHGFILFSNIHDYEVYQTASDTISRGEIPAIPPHLSLTFENGSELEPAMRKEIAEQGWEVVNAHAYPDLFTPDQDHMVRPVTADDITLVDALSQALPVMLSDIAALENAWRGMQPVSKTLTVGTHAGEVTLTLAAPFPYERVNAAFDSHDTMMAELTRLARTGDEIDWNTHGPLMDQLQQRFLGSAEGRALPPGLAVSSLVMEFAVNYIGETIATLQPSELEEIIFEIIPRKVAVGPESATQIIEECRAFYRYLKRTCSLTQADACLAILGGGAVKRLKAALSDQSNFGMAKSLLTMGSEAGFDVSTKKGVEEWMRIAQDMPIPDSFGSPEFGMPAPLPPVVKPADSRARKKKRKAARKARKKSR